MDLKKHRRWHVFTAHWHYEGLSKEVISGCSENATQFVYWKHCCHCDSRQTYFPCN